MLYKLASVTGGASRRVLTFGLGRSEHIVDITTDILEESRENLVTVRLRNARSGKVRLGITETWGILPCPSRPRCFAGNLRFSGEHLGFLR